MGDEREQDAPRMPLWPPEPEPAQPQRSTTPPWQTNRTAPPSPALQQSPRFPSHAPAPQPDISDGPTMRVSAVPVSPATPARVSHAPQLDATEAATQRYSIAPADSPAHAVSGVADVADAPTAHVPSATPAPTPAQPVLAAPARTTAAPASGPVAAVSRAGEPLVIPTRTREEPTQGRRLGLTLVVIVLLMASAGGLYAYAASLAAAPQRVMANYCAAISRADYHAAYALLSANAKAQQMEAQFVTDQSAHDTIEGRVTGCSSSATQLLTPLSMIGSPRSLIFNATLVRQHAFNGQIALTRDAAGWHVAALSSSLQGIDLGPLDTESALCAAFNQHSYVDAYRLLSTPYQHEQGDANTFAHAFGATLTVTGCTPDLKTYRVNSADQKASVTTALVISVAQDSGAPSAFTAPATLTFVRESTGWRVDSITPLLNS